VKRCLLLVLVLLLLGAFVQAQIQVKPRVYDPDETGIVTSAWVPHAGIPNQANDNADHALVLQKTGPTTTNAAAVVLISGVADLDATNLTVGFEYKDGGHCGAGAPRFNVVTTDGITNTTHFLGCIYGTETTGSATGWTKVDFVGSQAYPPITDGKVVSISIVMDEGTDVTSPAFETPGSITLDNIKVNATIVSSKPGLAK
jgi:hypothetical protein